MEYIKDYWKTSKGEKLKISDMETYHIVNTIKFLYRNPLFYATGCEIEDGCYLEDNEELVNKKIHELEKELFDRGYIQLLDDITKEIEEEIHIKILNEVMEETQY